MCILYVKIPSVDNINVAMGDAVTVAVGVMVVVGLAVAVTAEVGPPIVSGGNRSVDFAVGVAVGVGVDVFVGVVACVVAVGVFRGTTGVSCAVGNTEDPNRTACVLSGVEVGFSVGFVNNLNKTIVRKNNPHRLMYIMATILFFLQEDFLKCDAVPAGNSQKQAGQNVDDSGNSSLQKGQRLVDIYNSKYVLRKCNINTVHSTRLDVLLSILCW